MTNDDNSIPPVTRDDPAAHSGDVVEENIAKLKALFPSIVTDGKIDFDVLRQLLGDEVEEGTERYGLNWKGKARARAFALTPSLGTLRPAKADSKDWDNTRNIMIEGDNLEVLKLLRKSYAGKVKLIYIDPPYNTGKDFVYPDNYTDSLAHYEALTGQRGEDGARMTSNKEASGRFHTDWLNMMYPRLMLAKELLQEDGIIFVSMADSEVATTRALAEQIFGASNFEGHVHWRRRHNQPNDPTKMIGLVAEHLICFAKNSEAYKRQGVGKVPLTGSFSNSDNDPRGDWASKPWKTGSDQNGSRYDIKLPSGEIQNEEWMGDEDNFKSLLADNRIVFPNGGTGSPRKKYFKFERQDEGQSATNWWTHEDVGHNQGANSEMTALFDDTKNVFSNPKPVSLVERTMQLANVKSNDIILDFFAGSGTTGHAVMAQNAADGGTRRYILVQLPEPLDPTKAEQKTAADFCDTLGRPRTIAELTKERLRRAGKKVKSNNPDVDIDTGFRVYKLSSSNLKPWSPGNDLAADLLDAAGNILPGRTPEDLLVELLLKTGIDLTLPTETREIGICTVHMMGGGTLIVCLSDIPADKARALGDGIADWLAEATPPAPTTFFFKDSGFDATPGGAIGPRSAEARSNLAATLRQRLGNDAIEKLGAI